MLGMKRYEKSLVGPLDFCWPCYSPNGAGFCFCELMMFTRPPQVHFESPHTALSSHQLYSDRSVTHFMSLCQRLAVIYLSALFPISEQLQFSTPHISSFTSNTSDLELLLNNPVYKHLRYVTSSVELSKLAVPSVLTFR